MTRDELAAMAHSMYGHEWQTPLARALGVNARTVRRWVSGDTPVPDWLSARLAELTGATATGLTTDEWIVGDSLDGARRYVVHTMHPRFIARCVQIDPDTEEPAEPDTDVQADSVVYRADVDLALAELHWIDSAPVGYDLTRLMEAACDAVERWEDGEAAGLGEEPEH